MACAKHGLPPHTPCPSALSSFSRYVVRLHRRSPGSLSPSARGVCRGHRGRLLRVRRVGPTHAGSRRHWVRNLLWNLCPIAERGHAVCRCVCRGACFHPVAGKASRLFSPQCSVFCCWDSKCKAKKNFPSDIEWVWPSFARCFLTPPSASQVPCAVPPRGCGAVPVRFSRTGRGRPGAGCVDSRGTGVHALLARRCRVARASLCRGRTQCAAGRCHGLLTHRCKRPPPSEHTLLTAHVTLPLACVHTH